jgi:hypothetical protein
MEFTIELARRGDGGTLLVQPDRNRRTHAAPGFNSKPSWSLPKLFTTLASRGEFEGR